MTESPTEPPELAPEAPDEDQATPEATEPARERFAVYDEVLLRFVGPVTDKRPSAKSVRALVGDHKHTVRKV